MTDNEIIKALEDARYHLTSHKHKDVINDAIDLINRQQEEIKELEAEIDRQYKQAIADIKGNIADGGTSCHWCIQQNKAEAIKEFADKLEANIGDEDFYVQDKLLLMSMIDNLVKEMVGGADESL